MPASAQEPFGVDALSEEPSSPRVLLGPLDFENAYGFPPYSISSSGPPPGLISSDSSIGAPPGLISSSDDGPLYPPGLGFSIRRPPPGIEANNGVSPPGMRLAGRPQARGLAFHPSPALQRWLGYSEESPVVPETRNADAETDARSIDSSSTVNSDGTIQEFLERNAARRSPSPLWDDDALASERDQPLRRQVVQRNSRHSSEIEDMDARHRPQRTERNSPQRSIYDLPDIHNTRRRSDATRDSSREEYWQAWQRSIYDLYDHRLIHDFTGRRRTARDESSANVRISNAGSDSEDMDGRQASQQHAERRSPQRSIYDLEDLMQRVNVLRSAPDESSANGRISYQEIVNRHAAATRETTMAKEARIKQAREADSKDATLALRYSRSCAVCLISPNPLVRVVLTGCGHIVCAPCSEQLEKVGFGSKVQCPFCRKIGDILRLFEDVEKEEAPTPSEVSDA